MSPTSGRSIFYLCSALPCLLETMGEKQGSKLRKISGYQIYLSPAISTYPLDCPKAWHMINADKKVSGIRVAQKKKKKTFSEKLNSRGEFAVHLGHKLRKKQNNYSTAL